MVESALDQLVPVEFRADLVIEFRDANGALVLAIVLEVQRDVDPDKEYAWLVYASLVRAKKRCATVVLVVAPDCDDAALLDRWMENVLGAKTAADVLS